MTPEPIDATTAAAALTAIGYPCRASQIHNWATRGKVRRVGRDKRGRTLFDPDELLLAARDSPATTLARERFT